MDTDFKQIKQMRQGDEAAFDLFIRQIGKVCSISTLKYHKKGSSTKGRISPGRCIATDAVCDQLRIWGFTATSKWEDAEKAVSSHFS